MTRPAVLWLLLALTACAHIDADERDRQRLAWHRCTMLYTSTALTDCR